MEDLKTEKHDNFIYHFQILNPLEAKSNFYIEY